MERKDKKRIYSWLHTALYACAGFAGLICALVLGNVWLGKLHSQGPGQWSSSQQGTETEGIAPPLEGRGESEDGGRRRGRGRAEGEGLPSSLLEPQQLLEAEPSFQPLPQGLEFPTVELPSSVGADSLSPPALEEEDTYSYSSNGKRDPFQPPLPEEDSNVVFTPPTELQQYELNQLEVLGIIWKVGKAKAMLRDPIGKVHVVMEGTSLGRRGGKIKLINENGILVEEWGKDDDSKKKIMRILGIKK